jgi:hypothetical protein
MPRTSPKSVVNVISGPPTVEFGPEALTRISALSGFAIPPEKVPEIAHAVREYMIATTFERAAVSNNDIANEVETFRKLAGELLSRSQRPTASRAEILDGATDAIDRQLAHFDRENAPVRLSNVNDLWHVLTLLIAASNKAQEEIRTRTEGVFGDHGAAWRTFIRTLDRWATDNGLSVSPGRGDTDKRNAIQPSQYVAFVAALLAEIPVGYKIEYQSDMALRGRIIKARS